MPWIESPEATVAARKLYGEEGAARLLSEIVDWHELASDAYGLDLSCAVNVEVGVSDQVAGGYFEPRDGSINLLVPRRLDAEARARIPAMMVHENAHRKRHEVITLCWWLHENPRDQLLCGFLNEGLATLAEGALLGEESRNTFSEQDQQDRQFIDGLLLDLLFFAKINANTPTQELERYLYGTPTRLLARSYKVGHYIVAKAACLYNLTINEALEMPDQFYREFAEERL